MGAPDPDNVIYLGSFSETFASGLRVGWALAPSAVRDKLVLAAESATLCPPTFDQMIVSAYLAGHDWRGQIKSFREMYRERRDAMLDALRTHLPAGGRWTHPDGGSFVWVTVPEGVDTRRCCCPARCPPRWPTCPARRSTLGLTQPDWAVGSRGCPTATRRRNGSPRGVRRLADVLNAELDVLRTFGSPDRAAARLAGGGARRGPHSPSPDTT